jgi:hypothetical protein
VHSRNRKRGFPAAHGRRPLTAPTSGSLEHRTVRIQTRCHRLPAARQIGHQNARSPVSTAHGWPVGAHRRRRTPRNSRQSPPAIHAPHQRGGAQAVRSPRLYASRRPGGQGQGSSVRADDARLDAERLGVRPRACPDRPRPRLALSTGAHFPTALENHGRTTRRGRPAPLNAENPAVAGLSVSSSGRTRTYNPPVNSRMLYH